MKKILAAIMCITLLLVGCTAKEDITNPSSVEVFSSEVSSVVSSELPSSKPAADPLSYTSIDVVRRDSCGDGELEKLSVTDLEQITEIHNKIAKIVSNEETPTEPIMPSQGGTDYYVRFYKNDVLTDEYLVAGKATAKRVDGKFVEWYDSESETHTYFADLILPLIKQTSSLTESSSISSSSEVTSSEPEGAAGIKRISVSINSIEEPVSYTLSPKEEIKFVELWGNLELEFVRNHRSASGTIPPGYGSFSPCSVTVQYPDKKEDTFFSFRPSYHENGCEYKIISGAKEMLEFISNLDCYKKAKIDLYAMWLEDNKE